MSHWALPLDCKESAQELVDAAREHKWPISEFAALHALKYGVSLDGIIIRHTDGDITPAKKGGYNP